MNLVTQKQIWNHLHLEEQRVQRHRRYIVTTNIGGIAHERVKRHHGLLWDHRPQFRNVEV